MHNFYLKPTFAITVFNHKQINLKLTFKTINLQNQDNIQSNLQTFTQTGTKNTSLSSLLNFEL
jgi:hypothetical protein